MELCKALLLRKAKTVPVGTISTLSNGTKVKKVAEGKWLPVTDGAKTPAKKEDVEGLKLRNDGFYYEGEKKITNDPNKAREYSKKRKESGGAKEAPQIKPGERVRVKAGAKGSLGRGVVAKVKEIGKDFVRIVTEEGKVFRVPQQALEYAKSIKTWLYKPLIKSQRSTDMNNRQRQLSFEKAIELRKARSHKYIRKEGKRYIYKESEGKKESKDVQTDSMKDAKVYDHNMDATELKVPDSVKKYINRFLRKRGEVRYIRIIPASQSDYRYEVIFKNGTDTDIHVRKDGSVYNQRISSLR